MSTKGHVKSQIVEWFIDTHTPTCMYVVSIFSHLIGLFEQNMKNQTYLMKRLHRVLSSYFDLKGICFLLLYAPTRIMMWLESFVFLLFIISTHACNPCYSFFIIMWICFSSWFFTIAYRMCYKKRKKKLLHQILQKDNKILKGVVGAQMLKAIHFSLRVFVYMNYNVVLVIHIYKANE